MPRRRRGKRGSIELLCDHCGKRVLAPRAGHDPDRATLIITNECDRCNAAAGGFGMSWYYDICGNQISDDEVIRATG